MLRIHGTTFFELTVFSPKFLLAVSVTIQLSMFSFVKAFYRQKKFSIPYFDLRIFASIFFNVSRLFWATTLLLNKITIIASLFFLSRLKSRLI